jgi:hypothetical protein
MSINDCSKSDNLYVFSNHKLSYKLNDQKKLSKIKLNTNKDTAVFNLLKKPFAIDLDGSFFKVTLLNKIKKSIESSFILRRLISNIINMIKFSLLRKFSSADALEANFYFTIKIGDDIAFIGKNNESFYLYGLEGKGKNLFEISLILKVFNIQNFDCKNSKD